MILKLIFNVFKSIFYRRCVKKLIITQSSYAMYNSTRITRLFG